MAVPVAVLVPMPVHVPMPTTTPFPIPWRPFRSACIAARPIPPPPRTFVPPSCPRGCCVICAARPRRRCSPISKKSATTSTWIPIPTTRFRSGLRGTTTITTITTTMSTTTTRRPRSPTASNSGFPSREAETRMLAAAIVAMAMAMAIRTGTGTPPGNCRPWRAPPFGGSSSMAPLAPATTTTTTTITTTMFTQSLSLPVVIGLITGTR
mmetsp:Transcript_20510/g.43480  ORF Transcript_20510/g.43480 Transcript_20510/m.43480 type:complete len:209 (-) Transcript_20510:1369-1995(-)